MYLKDPTKRVQYTFRIKEDLMEDLKVYANAKDMKLPRLLNNIIEEYLEGMNMSNTWSNEPLRAIITIPNEIPIKYHSDALIPRINGLQYEVKAMPYNLDSWNDKYGFIANTKGMKHKGVEPLIIPGLIKDLELKKDNATAQTIAQCLFALYFVIHDNDQLHVEIISHDSATGQLQFVNPNMAKVFAKYRTMLYDIINDNLTMLNDVNHNKVKQQLIGQLEDLAVTINTGNVVPIIGQPGGTNTLQSDNPYLNGSKPKFIPFDGTVKFETGTIYEDMQKRIDELEKENDQYKNEIKELWEELHDMDARQKVWEDYKKRNEELWEQLNNLKNRLDETQPVIDRLDELEKNRDKQFDNKPNNAEKEDKNAFEIYKDNYKK